MEQPPAPASGEGVMIVELHFYLRIGRVDSLLAGFQIAIQDFHTCGDKVFDHHIVSVVRQDQCQPRGDRFVGAKLERGERRAVFTASTFRIDTVNRHARVDRLNIFYRTTDIQHRAIVQAPEPVFALDGEQVG